MTALPVPAGGYDIAGIRRDFPILSRQVHGRPLVYLDNAASAQKPKHVLDAMTSFMTTEYANVHRGVHFLSAAAAGRALALANRNWPRDLAFTVSMLMAVPLTPLSITVHDVGVRE